jgi:hypothetical protein
MQVSVCQNIEALLLEMFDSDKELLNSFHIEAPCSLDKAVDRTLKDLQMCEVLMVYQLKTDSGELVGWIGHEVFAGDNYLTGFGIKPKFRTKEMKDFFFDVVKEKLGDNYFVGLYERNFPARKFIEKRGGKVAIITDDGKNNCITMYHITKEPCQQEV